MWGQLHYHLACLLLRKTKREQGSWSDTGRLCAPLLLAAMHVQPIDPTATWALSLKEQTKLQLQLWQREGSFRCSQAGHVLQDYARDDVKRMMEKIDKLCIGSWRERIYQRIFVSKAHIATSYFANHNAPNPPLRLCSATEMKIYDEGALIFFFIFPFPKSLTLFPQNFFTLGRSDPECISRLEKAKKKTRIDHFF